MEVDMSRGKFRGNEESKEVGEAAVGRPKSFEQGLTYDVLRIIFRSLDAKDLATAAMVCRNWLEAANHEKRTRGPDCCIKYRYRQCFVANRKFIDDQFIISGLRVKPVLSLFTKASSCDAEDDDEPLGCYCSSLPPTCTSVKLNTAGIVYNNLEIETQSGHLLCLFLPDVPGLTIKTFVMAYDYPIRRDTYITAEKHTKELKEVFKTNAKNSKESNCFLLFCDDPGREVAIRVLHSLKKSYPGDTLSVWGGVVSRNLTACYSDTAKRHIGNYVHCVGIALTGPILTWSIIVDKSYKTKEQVEQRLKLLRNRVRLKRHSVGFMFACCARGKSFYEERNVESTIFKNFFPDVPLFGCFGDGEFGENTIPNESSKKKTQFYNEKSTVFMILSYD